MEQLQGIEHFDKAPLLSNNQTINHQPDRFILDFKGAYPQYSPDITPTLVIRHKVVLLDPYGAKEFLKILQENVRRYEETYGKIRPPKALATAKKKAKKQEKEVVTASPAKPPSYLG